MSESVIYYPNGSGGSWLSNLIWHLENNDFTMPNVKTVFDSTPKTRSFNFMHSFVGPADDPTQIKRVFNSDSLIFSSTKVFNIYINHAYKNQYVHLRLGEKSIQQQFFSLSDDFRYFLNDAEFQDAYCTRSDIDYRLIFQDPEQFVDRLFDLLSLYKVYFVSNKEYALTSIEYYKSTCPDPKEVLGNLTNLVWLGCCHGIMLTKNISLPTTISAGITLEELTNIMEPYNNYCIEIAEPLMFKWKK